MKIENSDMLSTSRAVIGCAVAAALFLGERAAAVDAQPQEPSAALEEIVITAQRRPDTLQKTSIPMQVVSAAELKNAGVVQMRDLVAMVPGLQIADGGASTQIYIRGVGDFGSTPITNPAVATNLDGIYVATTQSVEGNFFDIARVEVLKGPQGTLYGRNASGGAINIITNRPVLDEFGGYADIEFGNYDEILSEAAVNLPISTAGAVRISAQDVSRRGYLSEGLDDDHHQSARVQGLWQAGATSVLIVGDYTHIGGEGNGSAVIPPQTAGTNSAWTAVSDPRFVSYYNQAAAAQGNCLPGGFFPGVSNPGACPPAAPYPSPPFPTGTVGPYTSTQHLVVGAASQDNRFWSTHAEITSDLGFATLTVLPAYQDADTHWDTLQSGLFYQVAPSDSKAESIEARLSANSSLLKWVGGLYYFHQTQDSDELIYGGLVQNQLPITDQSTRSKAVFGELTFSLTDTTRLIAGGRYTDDLKTIAGSVDALYPNVAFLPTPGDPTSLRCAAGAPNPCLLETYAGSRTFDKFTWKAGLEQDLTPKNMLYATASTGFKAGGFDQSATPTPGSTQALSFNPETLTAFELGSRNRFSDDRLQVNVEAFYWKYKDHQEARLTEDGQGVLSLDIVNAGQATAYGLDLDVVAKPTREDTVHGSVEYLHSRYDSFAYDIPANPSGSPFVKGVGNGFTSFNPLSPLAATTGCAVSGITSGTYAGGEHVDCSGFPLTHAPAWSGSLGYDHRFPLPAESSLTAAVDAAFATDRYIAADFLPSEQVPSYVTENVYLTYAAAADRWSVQAFVRNLSNAVAYTGGYEGPVAGIVSGSIAPPRTYGARVTVHF